MQAAVNFAVSEAGLTWAILSPPFRPFGIRFSLALSSLCAAAGCDTNKSLLRKKRGVYDLEAPTSSAVSASVNVARIALSVTEEMPFFSHSQSLTVRTWTPNSFARRCWLHP